AQLPTQLPAEQDQDRPRVREGAGGHFRQRGHHPLGDRHRQDAEDGDHRRGRRDARAVPAAGRARLHRGPRLPYEQAGARRAGGRADRPLVEEIDGGIDTPRASEACGGSYPSCGRATASESLGRILDSTASILLGSYRTSLASPAIMTEPLLFAPLTIKGVT